jgi:hypothetical protein
VSRSSGSRPRKKKPAIRSRKAQPDPYTSRILKQPSKRELDATLKHAVRNHDYDALDDYDEQVRAPVGAVKVKDSTTTPEDAADLGYRILPNGSCVPDEEYYGDNFEDNIIDLFDAYYDDPDPDY